ncbi:hypothetical protein C6P45_000572 [Maudiozyma exigua]|uniref:Uncharacterized protein n=1 Tax=Maudiozyma exigua TaxID=34358 RepID=A0A9P7B8W6_MAUEX|nr:hypothetical protein C6P45_000572 [Kazachstania exigua]
MKFSLLCFIYFSTFSSATKLADICDGGYVYYFAQTNLNKGLTYFDGVPALDNIGLTVNDDLVYDASDVTGRYTDLTYDFDIEIPNDGNNHTGTILGQEVTVLYTSLDSNTIPPVNPYSTGFPQQSSFTLYFPQQSSKYNQGGTPDMFYQFKLGNPYIINSNAPFNTGTHQNQFWERGHPNPS